MLIDVVGSVKHLRRLIDGNGHCEPGTTVDALDRRNVDAMGDKPGVHEVHGVGVRCDKSIYCFLGQMLTVPVCRSAVVPKKVGKEG